MSSRFYVINAELTFEDVVSREHQDDVEFAVGQMQTPTDLKPSVRWMNSRCAKVDDLGVSAGTSGHAIQSARDSLREAVRESTHLPVLGFAALSVKRGVRPAGGNRVILP